MRTTNAFLAVLTLAPTAFAQGNTIPPGLVSTEGPSYCYYVGSFPNLRSQLATGLYKGKVLVTTEMQFRQDGSYVNPSAVARSWSNVKLSVADSNFATLSSTFSTNIIGTPTMVFSSSLNWPALSTKSPTSPGAWAMGGLKLPYISPHIYSGANDLVLDLTFTGGVLSNAGTWGTGFHLYFLDGVRYPTGNGGSFAWFGLPNCLAYRSTYMIPDSLLFQVLTYAKKTGNTANDDTIQGYTLHFAGSPSAAHIGAIGLTGVTSTSQGTNIGTCQPLMMTPMIYLSYTTNAGGFWSGPRSKIPFNQNLVGVNLWAQAAHGNGTGGINLSRPTRSTVQPQPQNPQDYKMIYGSVTSTTGQTTQLGLPVVRLK